MDLRGYTRLFETLYGHPLSPRAFLQAGDRIVVLERLLNVLEGVRQKDDTLPERILEEARPCDVAAGPAKGSLWHRMVRWGCPETPPPSTTPQRLALDSMLERYYALRGYNRNGMPLEKTLKRLKLVPRV
ncbi:MAG: aldehyde ferredoxin oxidoreductase C-terminal domain-containing protein [Desulfosoma sp.]|uniref:aldehyde ferredoxin oxidoreductase C-terminal domain-containing protein n=1 Tax=Desulfosoma sp. TaxID=2603217 RepID=UPI0040490390